MKLGSLIRDKASGLRNSKKSSNKSQQDGVDDHNNGYTSHSISSLNSDHLHDNNHSKKDDTSDLRREGIVGIDTSVRSDRGSRHGGSRHGGSPSK